MSTLEEKLRDGFLIKEKILNVGRRTYEVQSAGDIVARVQQTRRFWGTEYVIEDADGIEQGRISQKVNPTGVKAQFEGGSGTSYEFTQNLLKDAIANPFRPKRKMTVVDGKGRAYRLEEGRGEDLQLTIYDGQDRVVGTVSQRDKAGGHQFGVQTSGFDPLAALGITAVLDTLYNHQDPRRSKW